MSLNGWNAREAVGPATEAEQGHKVIMKYPWGGCSDGHGVNDISNQTSTTAFDHPDFENQKEARTARRLRSSDDLPENKDEGGCY
jgi:hypothetical protein